MKPRDALTNRQQRILAYLQEYIRQHGYAPSTDEIMSVVGVSSKSEVHRDLRRLEERGYIRKRERIARGLTLCQSGPAADLRAVIEEAAADIEELAEWAPALEPAEMQAAIRARAEGLRAALSAAGVSL